MRVLFLSAGKSIHTVRWVNALVNRGIELHLVYNKGHEPLPGSLNSKVVCHCLKYSGGMAYYMNAGELRAMAHDIKPDVVNVHYASGYGTLARKAKLSPLILSIWGSDVYDFPYESKIKNEILKKNVNYAAFLASTSECMAAQLRRVMGDAALEICVTPFGVDLEQFSLEDARNTEEIILGNIKTLSPKYGIDVFIDSVNILFQKLKEEGYNDLAQEIKVAIYGEGDQKAELEQKVNDLGLNDTVRFYGRIPNAEVPQKLKEFTVFCATSVLDSESFGVAVVEAMAMEVPVVVSDVDGFKEVVKSNETGIIVPRKDVEKTAEALFKLVVNQELRKQYGQAGRKRVEEYYNWDHNVDTMIQLYERVMQENNYGK